MNNLWKIGLFALATLISTGLIGSISVAIAQASFEHDLSIGNSGPDVAYLQTFLNQRGLLGLAPTGYFGLMTADAVMKYQKANGLPVSGFVGPLTRAKLQSDEVAAKNVAELVVSPDSTVGTTTQILANEGQGQNEKDGVALLSFNLNSAADAVKVTDINISVVKSGGGSATVSTNTYLYQGDTLIGSGITTGTTTAFSDIDLNVLKDATTTLIVKADILGANADDSFIQTSVQGGNIVAENASGISTSVTSLASNTLLVRNSLPLSFP